MANAAQSGKGLLVATMEPPANIEEEFQDWYDSEHFPERETCAGFETATRFVCVDGWPRYLALYDLTNVDVLHGPAYAAIAISRFSPFPSLTSLMNSGTRATEPISSSIFRTSSLAPP